LAVLIAVFCGMFTTGCSAQAQSPGAAPSLYKRLGGYDAIAAVTDDFLGRLAADKQMSRFFVGVSADSLKKLRQHVVLQLCEATGGPCNYFGRSMKTTHAGLGITESDWQITLKHLNGTLDLFKVPENERNEILTLFASLKRDIVEK
jgi:hemoglobin